MKKTLKERLAARFRGKQPMHKLLSATGSTLNPDQWVFIVGCYNSGTTLLQDILSIHPGIGIMNDEGVMLTDCLPRPEDYGWRRMWVKCEEKMKVDNPARSAALIKKHWSHFYPDRPLLLEKSISNTSRIPFFKEYFKPVKFIHLVRNGYAVAEGICRKAQVMETHVSEFGEHYPIDLCAQQWVRSLEVVHGNMDESILEVTYEDLTERPDEILEQICHFLNIDLPDRNVSELTFSIHGKTNAILNMNEKSLKSLSREDVKRIDQVAGEWLDRYGYR